MSRRTWLLVLGLGATMTARGTAQVSGGTYLPAGSRAEALVDWLIAEGALERLDPLTRPRRIGTVRRALHMQDTIALGEHARRTVEELTALLDFPDSTMLFAEAGFALYRDGNRDSFRPGGVSGSAEAIGIWAGAERGAFTIVLNPAIDNRLRDDTEYRGKKNRFIAGRLQNAYVSVGGAIGELSFGRMARAWGPAMFDGLQVSPVSYATDQLAGVLRVGRFELTTIAQRLDDYDTVTAVPIARYFLAHRLSIRAGRGLWLVLTETGVYGGPGRGLEPALHMPLGSALLAEFNENKGSNVLWGLEVHARLSRFQLQLHAVIDDIQLDDSVITDQRPTSGGFTVAARTAVPGIPVHLSLGYTRVLSLTYRNSFAPWNVYASRNVGIARNDADYDQARLRLDTRVGARFSGSFEASYLRQGSGDFRLPFPPDSTLSQPGQGFLVSPVVRATAFRITGAFEPVTGIHLNGELGIDGNPTGSSRTIAAISIRARVDLLHRRRGAPWAAVEGGANRSWP